MGGLRLKRTMQQPDGALQFSGFGHQLPLHSESLPLPESSCTGILFLNDEANCDRSLLGHPLSQDLPDACSCPGTSHIGMKQKQTDVPLMRPWKASQELDHPSQITADLQSKDAFVSSAQVRGEWSEKLSRRLHPTRLTFDALKEVAAGEAQVLEALAVGLRQWPQGKSCRHGLSIT